MSAAVRTDVWWLEPFHVEGRILRASRPNVLIEGPAAATHAVVRLLQPHIGGPIAWRRARSRLDLPSGETNGLILRDLADLGADDQTGLLQWLGGAGSCTQIVATTERPLFPLVARGLFDEMLYYRLNVMLLRVESRTAPRLPHDEEDPVHRHPERPTSPATTRV